MFKKISTSFIGITLASLAISPAFAQDDAATAAIKNLDPLSHQLTWDKCCLLYTSPSPRDRQKSRMPSSA